MNDSLGEFLDGRVLATREVAHLQYPVDSDMPSTGVMIDCPETAITVILLPTFVRDALHMEVHCFVDGQRQDTEITEGPNGYSVLQLRKSPPSV